MRSRPPDLWVYEVHSLAVADLSTAARVPRVRTIGANAGAPPLARVISMSSFRRTSAHPGHAAPSPRGVSRTFLYRPRGMRT